MKLLIPLFVLIVALIACWSITQERKAKLAESQSLVSSLYAVTQHSRLMESAVSSTTQWRTLDESEYDRLISNVVARSSIDAGPRGWTADGRLVDSWGHRLKIAVRKDEWNAVDLLIWSKGPDSISGTPDDIVMPRSNSSSGH